jgi:hypothetical protein
MYSRTMQQGDKNCLATFQRLMNNTFSDMIGVFIHCYQDDIFVYSNTLEEHEEHLQWVFDRLREHKLFLSSNLKKIDLLSTWMDCLGFFIDDEGIHLDPSKIDKIASWRIPRNYHDVQKFTLWTSPPHSPECAAITRTSYGPDSKMTASRRSRS